MEKYGDFGYNGGQFGIGNTTSVTIPTKMLELDGNELVGVKQISAGNAHVLILKEDGTVWATGKNSRGQLGNGTTTTSTKIVQVMKQEGEEVTPVTNAKHVYADGQSSYILKESEGLYSFGYNNVGQLLTQDKVNRLYATEVEKDKNIVKLGATENNTNAVVFANEDGEIFTCGYNANGELADGTTRNAIVPVNISGNKIITDKKVINLGKSGDTEKINYTLSVAFNLYKDELPMSTCTFKSLDENIATVNSEGVVTANKLGTTYIKLYNAENNVYEAVKINVTGEDTFTAAKVSGRYYNLAALKTNGTLYLWGHNGYGQLGTQDTNHRSTPVIPTTIVTLEDGTETTQEIKDVKDVANGEHYTVILREDGTVWTSGYNNYGQLGNGTKTDVNTFVKVKINSEEYLENVIAVASGTYTSYALTADGTVYAWGYNSNGELSQDTSASNTESMYAIKMQKVSNIIKIAAGDNYLIMLKADGTVIGVGSNSQGQLGTNNTTQMNLPTQMLDAEGNILTNVKDIEAGERHTIILKEDGSVWTVGCNDYGQCGNGTTTTVASLTQVLDSDGNAIKNVRNVFASENCTFITVNKDNSGKAGMYAIGYNEYGQLFTKDTENKIYATKVEEDKDILYASNSLRTGIMVTTNGMIYTVGSNNYGQLGTDSLTESIMPKLVTTKDLELEKHIIDFENIGETYQIKYKTSIEYNLIQNTLPESTITYKSENEDIAIVSSEGLITAKAQGNTQIKMYNAQNNLYATIKVNVQKENITTVEPKIVAGQYHYAAIKSDGSLWTWGYNSNGELGLGDKTNRTKPEKNSIKNVIDVATGNNHTLVLKKDGTVWSTGYNNLGQLGDGSTVNSNSFHKVKLNDEGDYLEDIVAIAAGDYSSYAITSKGEVYAWGKNSYGTLDQGSTDGDPHPYPVKMKNAKGIVAADAEYDYVVMLDYNGRVWGLRLWLWTIWCRKFIYNDNTKKNVRCRWK